MATFAGIGWPTTVMVIPFALGPIGVSYVIFSEILSKRYRGISMTLMEAGFVFGQLIVCAGIGWGYLLL